MESDLHDRVLVSRIAVGRGKLEYDQEYCRYGTVGFCKSIAGLRGAMGKGKTGKSSEEENNVSCRG